MYSESNIIFAQQAWIGAEAVVKTGKNIKKMNTWNMDTGNETHNRFKSTAVLRDSFSTGVCLKYAQSFLCSKGNYYFWANTYHLLL